MARARVFKSGNSTAVRLPASLGAVPGTVMEVREEQGRWILEPVADPPRTIDLTGIWGSIPYLKPIPSADREFDERPSTIAARAAMGRDDG